MTRQEGEMAKTDAMSTPMMKQYNALKAKHPDALLLFRCGDFYETYGKDASELSELLGLTLTRRSKDSVAMAGFPYHAIDTYLPRLVRAGRRVAICDQLEDPKMAKKLVKRGITELVTPGTAMSASVTDSKENIFLAAVHFGRAACGVAFLDYSTGEFLVGEGSYGLISRLLTKFAPSEVLYCRDNRDEFISRFGNRYVTYPLDDWVFTEQTARQALLEHFHVNSLKGFGVEHLRSGVTAAGAVLQYLSMTQHDRTGHVTRIARIDEDRYVWLDNFTVRSLEIVKPIQPDGASLLSVVDKTASPMGGRMLHRWLLFPLRDIKSIDRRLDVVEFLYTHPDTGDALEGQLRRIGDIERILSRVETGRVTPREVVQLLSALGAIQSIKSVCAAADCTELKRVGESIDVYDDLSGRIEKEVEPTAPTQVKTGGVIRQGVSDELDELRAMASGGKDYLVRLQAREAETTGIASLKIGFNNVFGYYLEVRNTYKDKVPSSWIRKQTLVGAERYVTPELKEYEEKILNAETRIVEIETQLFDSLVADIRSYISRLQTSAVAIARIDCLRAFAVVAKENGYVRPTVNMSGVIDIRAGRHPVIESRLPLNEKYIPNDVRLDTAGQQIMIITGPNMSGKSALLRQTALIVLLAQCGCFVPADSASIGIVDKLFTRVGASDNISLGESTFMVEMSETAAILNNVTPRSLVLFDELGRGTSTYDGIAVCWAVIEYIHENPRATARMLFATHYHELNEMEKHYGRIRNYNVSVAESDSKIIFLRKLARGGAEHSFGIHVAALAGMPKSIVERANVILEQLETSAASVEGGKKNMSAVAESREGMQLSFFKLDDPVLCQIRDEILTLDIDRLTPVEALCKLNDIKRILRGK